MARAREAGRSEPLRVALIGYGLAGASFHAPLIRAVPGLRLAAVVTSNPERQRAARSTHPGATVVERAERLWEQAGSFDLAVVATPNRTHVRLARAALEAGLHVVVDKPVARTADEGRGLIDAARQARRTLTVFQNRRWDGDLLTVRRLIDDGALGDVWRFESRFERWRPEPKAGWREHGAPEEAGGILYDLGSHLIDQALLLFGPVRQVHAEIDRRRTGVAVDDDVFVALEHSSGVRSHHWMSAVAAQSGPRLRVLGSRGAYVKRGMDVQEAALRAGAPAGGPGWGEEPRDAWGVLGAGEELHPVRTEPGAWQRFYEELAASLSDGTPPPVDPVDAVATLEVIEAAQRAAARGEVVHVT